MMECPLCGDPNVYEQEGGRRRYACPSCGWGTKGGGGPLRRKGLGEVEWLHSLPFRIVGAVLLWPVALAIIVGPWLALNEWGGQVLSPAALSAALRYYWIALPVYLLACWFIDPNMVEGPIRQQVFRESRRYFLWRRKTQASIQGFTLPGRIVLYTLGVTAGLFRDI